jgi:hypothetical protein
MPIIDRWSVVISSSVLTILNWYWFEMIIKPCNNYPMQLLGRAKFWTEDETPKEKVNFPKGGEFPKGGQNSWDTGSIKNLLSVNMCRWYVCIWMLACKSNGLSLEACRPNFSTCVLIWLVKTIQHHCPLMFNVSWATVHRNENSINCGWAHLQMSYIIIIL